MTSTVTMDFREEYEAERARWLRRRVLWFCGVSMALFGLDFFGSSVVVALGMFGALDSVELPAPLLAAVEITSNGLCLAVLIAMITRVARGRLRTAQLNRIVFWTIVLIGLLNIVPVSASVLEASSAAAEGSVSVTFPSAKPLLPVLYVHVLAALFVAWTPREAIRPLLLLLPACALFTLIFSPAPFAGRALFILLSPLIGVPGVLIGWWRHSRFRQTFHLKALRGHYGEMKRELADARRIHEVLFPPRIPDGPLRFDYQYEPMRHIGGDYLYTSPDASRDGCEPRLSVVIIDVTGHGIGAALTVNRLHGELERLFGERSDRAPGETLTALNHYVNVALAKHNVYATAICLRIDPHDEVIEWASAGHPPAFIRTAGGFLERLDPTAVMLGAVDDDAYNDNQRNFSFRPGDSVIAYTDGVIEARNQDGRMLTIDGMQRLVATLPPVTETQAYAAELMRAVQTHRFGAVQDDTLIVEVRRPLVRSDAGRDAERAEIEAS